MRALILAAGVGSRLMPLTADRPKALIEVASVPLVARILKACADAGADEAVLVTGYLRERLEAWLARADLPLPVRTVWNAEYATINNAHSLYVARDALADDDFVKLDGDLLLSPALLVRLMTGSGRTAALVDAKAELDPEAMKAVIRPDGSIGAFGKWLSVAEASGESIGVERIAKEDAPELFEAIAEVVHREGNHAAYYEDVYHRLLTRGSWRMTAIDTGGLPWTEIDDANDLARADGIAEAIAGART
ncbi:MAG: phosphocholine cytidylyltransferase family protein [Deltaproteobacteria bacterium]|nr:phosphocholine cytidylyltransferase family protein [Deltaproteobacteria bacterium]